MQSLRILFCETTLISLSLIVVFELSKVIQLYIIDEKKKLEKFESHARKCFTKYKVEQKVLSFNKYAQHIEDIELYEGYTKNGEHVIDTLDNIMNKKDIEYGTIDIYDDYIEELNNRHIKPDVPSSHQINRTVRKSLNDGINELYKSKPRYRPYETAFPQDNIRATLREFTVGEVVNTFYL